MNRHGYKVRKFGRELDQRRALIKGLADQLILNESIETTLPKAKATQRYTEKLISTSKKAKDNLHLRRQLISSLTTLEAAHKLVDEISPNLSTRNSGYLRVKRTTVRRGDNAQLARVSFVDDLKTAKAKKADIHTSDKEEDKAAGNRPKSKQNTVKASRVSSAQPKQAGQTAKRTGRRGNR